MVHGDESADSKKNDRLRTLLFATVLVTCSGQALWAVRAVDRYPLNDGPQHIFLGHLENVYDDPSSGYRAYIEPGSPISSRGFTTIFEPLDRLLGWRSALRITLSAAVLLWIVGFFVLVVSLDSRRRWLALLGPATAVQWALYFGFWSFFLATGFGFLVVAWLLKSRELTRARAFVLGAMLLSQAMMHAFATALTGLVLVAVALGRPRPIRSLLLVVAAGLPAAAIAVASTPALVAVGRTNEDFPPTVWLSAVDSIAVFADSLAAGPLWRGLPASVLALVGIGAGGVLGVAGNLRLGRALAGAALALVLAGLLGPYHLSMWQFFSSRFVPLGVALGAASLPVERLRASAAPLLVASLLVLYSVASNLWATEANESLAQAAEDAMSGLDAPISRAGPRLPVIIDRFLRYDGADQPWLSIDGFAPAVNLGHLYTTEQGGMPPYNFMGTPTLHNFVFRESFGLVYPAVPRYQDWFALWRGPDFPSPRGRTRVMTEVARYGRDYDDVILYGAESDAEVLVSRGYATDFRQGGLFIGHFEGCSGELSVAGEVDGAERLVAEYGMVPLPEPLWQAPLSLEAAAGPEGVVEPLQDVPCGDLWLRVVWVRSPERGDLVFCQGASSRGTLRVQMSADARLTCRADSRGAVQGPGPRAVSGAPSDGLR